ncbi:MAG: hypothetical protein LBR31_06685 [Desulfovibrio sp.]|jgi:hypothetical protein|nr:hypothetical protein [Desulfovibrio sp.]
MSERARAALLGLCLLGLALLSAACARNIEVRARGDMTVGVGVGSR